ncbi:MAG: response regulator [Gammaproteobacteria bacterium]|nr:response regulator [Gammaproteobacteria bacterium]
MTIKTLLIVDDSTTARLLIQAMLKELHPEWNYLQAANAEEALEILQKSPVDYFSIDYNMPNVTGLELIHTIRQNHPNNRIVLLTANIQPQVDIKAKQLDCLCLNKPLTDSVIKQAAEHFTHE